MKSKQKRIKTFETPADIYADVDGYIDSLKRQAREYGKDGGLTTNFGRGINIRTIKTNRQLYPSLVEDEKRRNE